MAMSDDLLVHGAGVLLTGDLERPRAAGDALLIRGGMIVALGSFDDIRPADDVHVFPPVGLGQCRGIKEDSAIGR